MKIALVTTFEQSVPPIKYGGTERIVATLADEFVRQGHDVTLLASGDSKTAARLIACTPRAIRSFPESDNPNIRQALNLHGLANAVRHLSTEKYEIIHNHVGWPLLLFEQLLSGTVVTTLHNTLDKDSLLFTAEHKMYMATRPTKVVSISDSQRAHCPKLNYVKTIYHGLSVEDFTFNPKPKDYLVFLGRIHPTKGVKEAIEIALKTDNQLQIAARLDPPEEAYFKTELEPLIDGKQIKYLGEINQTQKIALLKNAKALVSPLQWDEPFGMVYIEAMACGTPAIAIGRGSVPEILEHRKTGFVCKDVNEMIAYIPSIAHIDRQLCRKSVEARFTSDIMARNYLQLFQHL